MLTAEGGGAALELGAAALFAAGGVEPPPSRLNATTAPITRHTTTAR